MKYVYLCWEDNGESWEDYREDLVLVVDSYSKAKAYFEINGWQKQSDYHYGLDTGTVSYYTKENGGWFGDTFCSGRIEVKQLR